MITRAQEKELVAKGYKLGEQYKGYGDAKMAAQELRDKGYKARAVIYSTAIKGLHEFWVWYKK